MMFLRERLISQAASAETLSSDAMMVQGLFRYGAARSCWLEPLTSPAVSRRFSHRCARRRARKPGSAGSALSAYSPTVRRLPSGDPSISAMSVILLNGRHVWDYTAATSGTIKLPLPLWPHVVCIAAGRPAAPWPACHYCAGKRCHVAAAALSVVIPLVSSRAARVARSGTVRSNVSDGAGAPSPARCTKAVRSPWATAVRRSQATVIHVTVGGRHQARSRKLETRSHAAMKCADSAPADRLGWEALRTQPALVRQTIADGSHGTYAF